MSACAWLVKRPTRRNGIPKPKVYAKRRRNALDDDVVASAKIAPRAADTHGVHPTANAAPNTNEVK